MTPIPIRDGNCSLFERFLGIQEADTLMQLLLDEAEWHQPEVKLFGRTILSPRRAAWYGEPEAVYRYSGFVNLPLPWLPELGALRNKLTEALNCSFNSVLLNHYRDGNDAMGWHADNENELGPAPTIASVSLGETRRFRMRHVRDASAAPISMDLTHGSLLVMAGQTQRYWKHSVPRTRKTVGERINLTFREIRKF